jgi:hypothetical protein
LRLDRSLDASKPEDQFLSYGILLPAYDFMEKWTSTPTSSCDFLCVSCWL